MADITPPPAYPATPFVAEARARGVVGAAPTLSVRDLLAQTGVDYSRIEQMCAALAVPVPNWDERAFTNKDLEALEWVTELVDDGVLDAETEAALLRGISHSVERLVWWQFQVLADDAVRRLGLDDVEARISVLDHIADLADVLEAQMVYVWRRHLGATIRWIGRRLGEVPEGDSRSGALPLMRSVGFVDLVGYTETSGHLDAEGLAALVQGFVATAADTVAKWGGRVVKSLGDAVMFSAGDPSSGAMIALDLAETIGSNALTPPARVAMVWGSVLDRFGDVFGPTVNLASRLVAMADAGQVVVDEVTAAVLASDSRVATIPLSPSLAAGIGQVTPYRLVKVSEPNSRW
ncbi:MAG: adenylate/guanylate cyclase domain-containing protein [Bifidobacteriaceae bacterium]|jgi:adenylate cyclase|nr:adenylate/guanylate cyclase domain-containing protein [Bifidobacteriaceae bacterium]